MDSGDAFRHIQGERQQKLGETEDLEQSEILRKMEDWQMMGNQGIHWNTKQCRAEWAMRGQDKAFSEQNSLIA